MNEALTIRDVWSSMGFGIVVGGVLFLGIGWLLTLRRACCIGGHVWQTEVPHIRLHIGTEDERLCMIVTCRKCRKAKISYGDGPPRRMPRARPSAYVPTPGPWPSATPPKKP